MDRIGGVMVIVLTSSVVDRGFIGGVMVIVLTSSMVDRGFETRSGHTTDYEIGISVLVSYNTDLIIITLKINLFW